MGAYAPDEAQARTRALIAEGKTPRQIAPIVGVSWRTIYNWLDKWMHDDSLEQADRNQLIREYRISEKADNQIEATVDSMAESPPDPKYLIALNAISGTMRDKQFKRKELALKERDISRDMAQILAAIQDYAQSISPGSQRLLANPAAPESEPSHDLGSASYQTPEIKPTLQTTSATSQDAVDPGHQTKLSNEP